VCDTTGSIPDQSNPALYIKVFVNHKEYLMEFLEAQIKVRSISTDTVRTCAGPCILSTVPSLSLQPQVHRKLSDVVYNTLLELYLGEIGTSKAEDRSRKETRALELLKRPEVDVCHGRYSWCIYCTESAGELRH
jgi:hypothetical protein